MVVFRALSSAIMSVVSNTFSAGRSDFFYNLSHNMQLKSKVLVKGQSIEG